MTKHISVSDRVRIFAMMNQMAEIDLDHVEQLYGLTLGRRASEEGNFDEDYYPQFDEALRKTASSMGRHYEVFYCLENSIRELVSQTIKSKEGENWWNNGKIPTKIRDDVTLRIQRDTDSGTTLRSSDPLDFTNFGELSEIIKAHWDLFGAVFNSKKAVERVMSNLNTLRGPIAHCSPLAEDEVLRLRLSVKDWFRLME